MHALKNNERENEYMADKNGLHVVSDKNDDKIENVPDWKERTKNFFMHPVVATVAGTIISTLLIGCFGKISGLFKLPEQVSQMQTQIDNMQTQMDGMQEDIDSIHSDIDNINSEIKDIKEDISDLSERTSQLEGFHNGVVVEMLAKSGLDGLLTTNNLNVTSGPEWNAEDVIALDSKTGIEYTANDLINKNVLTIYEEDGYEIVFYGQYNENYHWNNACLTNTYKDGKLVFAMEGLYDDGNLQEYRQISAETIRTNVNVWTYSDRTVNNSHNKGISINYYRNEDIEKDFSSDNLTVENIQWMGDLKKQISGQIEGYYYGDTSDGTYNDDTGNAYLIKFADDGTVRTLYVGKFIDGKFNDNTGNAWYIVRDEEKQTDYMYYKGNFSNNSPENNSESEFKNNLTLEDIQTIIKNYEFDCSLKWYGFF